MATYRLLDLLFKLQNDKPVNPKDYLLSEWIELATSLRMNQKVSDDRESAFHAQLLAKVQTLLLNAQLITEEKFSELTA